MGESRRGDDFSRKGFFAFEDLEICQQATDLAVLVYNQTQKLPEAERYGLFQQLRRTVTSAALNIAEGRGRESRKDFAHLLVQSRGSVYEVVSACDLCVKLGYLTREDMQPIYDLAAILSARTSALIKKLKL